MLFKENNSKDNKKSSNIRMFVFFNDFIGDNLWEDFPPLGMIFSCILILVFLVSDRANIP